MKIAKGDKITVYLKSLTSTPVEVEVLAVTPTVGKHIAVVLPEAVAGGHTCDGRGPEGRCLWVHPNDVLTPEKAAELLAAIEARALEAALAEKDFVLEIGEEGVNIEEVTAAE